MRLVLIIKFWLWKFRSFKKMFETTCLSEVVAHWRFCLIDSKSLGYLCCGFAGRSMKRIKTCCKLHFFLRAIHMITGWLLFWNEFMSSPLDFPVIFYMIPNGPFISVQVIPVFNANECFQCCLHLFALCFRLCTACEIFRFIKQLSSSATSFTISNGEQRVSRICFVFKKTS